MGNMTLEQVNDMYLDVLREIGNIGAGNATTALAKLISHCKYAWHEDRYECTEHPTDGSITVGNGGRSGR